MYADLVCKARANQHGPCTGPRGSAVRPRKAAKKARGSPDQMLALEILRATSGGAWGGFCLALRERGSPASHNVPLRVETAIGVGSDARGVQSGRSQRCSNRWHSDATSRSCQRASTSVGKANESPHRALVSQADLDESQAAKVAEVVRGFLASRLPEMLRGPVESALTGEAVDGAVDQAKGLLGKLF